VKKKKKKKKKGEEEAVLIDSNKVFDEVIFLMKRMVDLVNAKPLVVDMFEDHQEQFIQIRGWLGQLMKILPPLLTEEGAALKGSGISRVHVEALREQSEIDVMMQVMALSEMDLARPLDDEDEEAFVLIRKIRQVQTGVMMHRLLGTIIGLPIESLQRDHQIAIVDQKSASPRAQMMLEDNKGASANVKDGDKIKNVLLAKIARLKTEKQVLDADIQEFEDEAISNVAKTYILRLFAVYAEDPEFAHKIVMVVGPDRIIEFLMHGDQNLQVAATVCLYQLARQEPACLDALEGTRGGIHFIGTQLTHLTNVDVMTHRIAVDLLVETSKRIELRKPMVQAGLVGPLLKLADAYARVMLGRTGDPVATALRRKIDAEHDGYARDMATHDGKHYVIENTIDIQRWCPFELKGALLLSEHILMSIMKMFGEFAEEDVFRAAFVGKWHGLQWLKDTVYRIDAVDVKIMTMRVLLGMASEPFGMDDILADSKMLGYYLELQHFKRDEAIEPGRIMAMESSNKVSRTKMHRVADFLGVLHRQASVSEENLVLCTKLEEDEMLHHQYDHMHDPIVLEIVRVRTLTDCFDIIHDACQNVAEDALRTAGVSVLSTLAVSINRLDAETFAHIENSMMGIRDWYIMNIRDRVLYDEIVYALVSMKRKHGLSTHLGAFRTSEEVFDYLWTLVHTLKRQINRVELNQPSLEPIQTTLTDKVLDIIRLTHNTRQNRDTARRRFNAEYILPGPPAKRVVKTESGSVIDLVDVQERAIRGWRKAIKLAQIAPVLTKKEENKAHSSKNALGSVMSTKEQGKRADADAKAVEERDALKRDLKTELAEVAFDNPVSMLIIQQELKQAEEAEEAEEAKGMIMPTAMPEAEVVAKQKKGKVGKHKKGKTKTGKKGLGGGMKSADNPLLGPDSEPKSEVPEPELPKSVPLEGKMKSVSRFETENAADQSLSFQNPASPAPGQEPELRQVLRDLGLSEYASLLDDSDIDLQDLQVLVVEDLLEIGFAQAAADSLCAHFHR
jgi:hypothetical protein